FNTVTGQGLPFRVNGEGLEIPGDGPLTAGPDGTLTNGYDTYRFLPDGTLEVVSFEGNRWRYERERRERFGPETFAQFIGSYRNPDLGVTYRVAREGDNLVLTLDGRSEIRRAMTPIRGDRFLAGIYILEFHRDS